MFYKHDGKPAAGQPQEAPMKSPYSVTQVRGEDGTIEFCLSRDDGRPVYLDGDLPVLAVNYSVESAAIEALQRYSREFYLAAGAV